ncbi:hypothetical protein tpqmel_0896, partial [Candidatus Gastranaerophilus sp. (ex Termes propinquus)]
DTPEDAILYGAEGEIIGREPQVVSSKTSQTTYSGKMYEQKLETLSDGTTRVTLQGFNNDEYTQIVGTLGKESAAGSKFTEVKSVIYKNPEKGFEMTTEGGTTKIKDSAKDVNITIEKVLGEHLKPTTITYEYPNKGPQSIKSTTIKGETVYQQHLGGDTFVFGIKPSEKVEFWNGSEIILEYDQGRYDYEGTVCVSDKAQYQHALADKRWENAPYNPNDKEQRAAHLNLLLEGGDYYTGISPEILYVR